MKNLNLIVLLLLLTTVALADDLKVKSKVDEATIYLQNAEILRKATATIPAGVSILVFENLETVIQSQSIQVKMSKEVKLLSVTYRTNYLKDKESSADYKRFTDSLDLIKSQMLWIDAQQEIANGNIKLLTDNQKLGSTQQGVSVADLKLLDAYYSARMTELKKELFDLGIKEANLLKVKTRLETQINQLNIGKTIATGEIVVEVTSKVAVSAQFELVYLVSGVSWSPVYDIRSEGIDKDVKIVYKANVVQNTGIDWKNVSIAISTGNPTANNSRPILSPRYLYFYEPITYSYDKSYAPAPMVQNMALEKDTKVKEREDMGRAYDDTPSENYVEMQVVETQMNIEYKVDQPYNIPSDGNAHLVTMSEYNIPATYEYHTVPVIDKGAYLLAKITGWGKLNLLEGYANIFFDNNYIGQSYINPKTTADTLLLSFGRDDMINVKRDKNYQISTVTTALNTKKHTVCYEITVRNTKSKAIKIEILDQIPVSTIEEIEVELVDGGGATYLAKIGKLSWDITLNPNESKTLKFTYTVKHPKNKIVEGI